LYSLEILIIHDERDDEIYLEESIKPCAPKSTSRFTSTKREPSDCFFRTEEKT
jgi:hypothetical protein